MNLFKLMTMIDGCQSYFKKEKLEVEENTKLKLNTYNEMRDIVISLYRKEKAKIINDE